MNMHTPGPWGWDGKFTVTIPHAKGDAAFRTNPEDARLIAAAPELLAALVRAKTIIRDWHGEVAWDIYDRSSPEMNQINAAIAKAEGVAQEGRVPI